ncbi:MAG: hypothetical protein AAFV07_08170 [Bacteroidota bacterium]
MEDRDDLTIRIDRYLKGEMATAEREAFEAECKADTALAQSLAIQAQAEIAVRAYAQDIRRAELTAQFDTLPQPVANIRPLPRMWPAIAVAAAVIILFVTFLLLPPGSQALDNQQLYAQSIGERPALTFVRTIGESADTSAAAVEAAAWALAAQAYNDRDYDAAIQALQKMLNDPAIDSQPKVQFYLGLSYLWMQDSLDAAGMDSEVNYRRLGRETLALVDSRSSFGEKASWYGALSLLANDNVSQAIPALEAIAAQPLHYRRNQAMKLIEQLKLE